MNYTYLLCICFFSYMSAFEPKESFEKISEFEKLSREKEQATQKSIELEKQKAELEKRHEDLERQAHEQREAMDEKEQELENLKREEHKTSEHYELINSMQNELSSYEEMHEELTGLEEQIDKLQSSLEDNDKKSDAIEQQQKKIKDSTNQIVAELNQQENNIMKAQKKNDAYGAARSFETISELISSIDFQPTVVYVVEQLTHPFIGTVKDALKTINNNLEATTKRTQEALGRAQKEIMACNTRMQIAKSEISKKNGEIGKLTSHQGFGGSNAYTMDLVYEQKHVSAQDVLSKSIDLNTFNQILDNGYSSIAQDIRNNLQSLADKLNKQNIKGASDLKKALEAQSPHPQDILDAYNTLPIPSQTIKTVEFQNRIDVLDALMDAKEKTLELNRFNDDLKLLKAEYEEDRSKLNRLNKRLDDSIYLKQSNEKIIASIDSVQRNREFSQQLFTLPDKLMKDGSARLNFSELKNYDAQLTAFESDLSLLNPRDIVQDSKLGDRRELMLGQEVGVLKHYLASVEFFLKENQSEHIYGELDEQSLLIAAVGQEDNAYKNVLEVKRKELGDTFIPDKEAARTALRENKRSSVDLKKYGFADNVTVQMPGQAVSDAELDIYMRDAVYNYVVHHMYDVLGMDETKAATYSKKDIDAYMAGKQKFKDYMVEKANKFKMNNLQQGVQIEQEALDSYKGPYVAYSLLDMPTGKKTIDALRQSDEKVKKMISVVTQSKFTEINNATTQLAKYISHLDKVKNVLNDKIKVFDEARNSLH